ncbi:MAG: trypsin-like peptidase domain-containing protein [Saprospiraceae bacterium]|nr:trypsin-like peptidase domain-containing protein [Saprospiraceae bacterium]
MKQFISLLFAGVIGGIATVGGLKYYDSKNTPASSATSQVATAHNVNYTPVNVPFDFTVAASKSLDAVVHIKAAESNESAYRRQLQLQRSDPFSFFFGQRGPEKGSGSGVIISQDGYIVTNNHVVDFADQLEVTLHDGRVFDAVKVGTYPNADIAVIKIKADDLKPIKYGNSDDVKVGQWALAVGNPFDLTSTVTAGIISAKGRSIDVIHTKDAVENFIQTDAAVNPGNSGGALVDVDGNLIGINTAIATPTGTYAGYAFAIPVNQIIPIVENIIKNNGDYSGPNLGAKPSLGVIVANVSDLTPEQKNENGIDAKSGVLLLELQNGGSAQYSGLLPNDVIIKVNDIAVNTIEDLKGIMKKLKPDDTISVSFKRGNQIKQLDVKLRS